MKLAGDKRTERILIVTAIVAAALCTFLVLKAANAEAQTTTTCDKPTTTTTSTSSTSTSTSSTTSVTAGPASVDPCDCDLDRDGEFIVTDVLVLLQELVGTTEDICAVTTSAGGVVELVWSGPPMASADFTVAYDADGFAAPCEPAAGLLSAINDEPAIGEARFGVVNNGDLPDGTVLYTCVLDAGQDAGGMLSSVQNATNFALGSIAGNIDIVPK